jgi:parallel beta-helix repeat protein
MKKSLVIIIVLFTATSFISTIGSISIETASSVFSNDEIFYVGGNGSGNYSTIQDAINDAYNESTIFVYNGIYHEKIVIDKIINLNGEIKNETIIDGLYNKNIIHILSEKAFLQNFTIRNSGGFKKNAGIVIESENNTIKNCIFYRTKTGILLNNTKNNMIDNCTFHTNGEGILFETSKYNSVISCCFGHNAIGLHFEKSEENSISFCYAHTNGIAFLLNASSKTNIFHCNISDNCANLGGIFIVGCSELNLTNSIINHNGAGVHIFSSEKIQITKCDFIFNTHFAAVMRTPSYKVEINQCEIKNNLRHGIYIEKGNDCKIIKNNIKKNTLFGIYSILSPCKARYNWWGSSFGPSYFDRKSKDRISFLLGKLRCFPWQLKPLEKTGPDWKENEPYMIDETNDSTEKQINLPGNDTDGDNAPGRKMGV